jgi:manganese/zinc/iron transport system substrate-binding protein
MLTPQPRCLWRPAIIASRLAVTGLATALLLGACDPWAAETSAAEGRLRVVATIGMISDVAQQIGGDRVFVQGLMGPGVDPHLYKARAGDVRRLARADLILFNGLHLEAAMGEVLEELGRRRHTVAVAASIPEAELLSLEDYPGNHDPHIWFDVTLWAHAARNIGRALADADPAHAGEYSARTAAYVARLEELHAWVHERVAELPPERRVLITAHDAFGYFGRAYGFEVMALQGISTTSEAGTGDVRRLAGEIERRRIPAIFLETSIPPRTVSAVIAAVGARGFRVEPGGELYSDAMGDAGTPEGTYIGMVRHNVDTIVGALLRDIP